MNLPDELIEYILDYLTYLPKYSCISHLFNRISSERYRRLQQQIGDKYPICYDEPTSIKYYIQKAAYLNDWDIVDEISHKCSVEINIYTLSVYHTYNMYKRADRLFHHMYATDRELVINDVEPSTLYYLYKLYPSEGNIEILKNNLENIDHTYIGYLSEPIWSDLETLLPELDEDQCQDSGDHKFWIALVAEYMNRDDDSLVYYRDGGLEYAYENRDNLYGDLIINIPIRKDKYIDDVINALISLDIITPKWMEYLLSLLKIHDNPIILFPEDEIENNQVNPLVFEYTKEYWINNIDEIDGYASSYAISQVINSIYNLQ